MKVVVDARMIKASGIGTYIRNLLFRIGKLYPDIQLLLILNEANAANELRKWVFKKPSVMKTSAKVFSVSEQLLLPLIIPPSDIYWVPNVNVPMLPIRARHMIVTVHDVLHLSHPEFFKRSTVKLFKLLFMQALKRSDVVLTVSNFSKQEILRFSSVEEEKIHVVYPGVDLQTFSDRKLSSDEIARLRFAYGLPERFLLYVGNVKPHKNVVRLLKAFDKLSSNAPHLVIVGRKDGFITGDNQVGKVLSQMRKRDKVLFTGVVKQEDLPNFYRLALALVFPSLYEGFGLPPLEAQASGCPVILSNAASLPEVYGNTALYCDPYDVDDIAEKIQLVLDDHLLREKLRQAGLENAKRFSWEESARQIISIFISACSNQKIS